MLFASAKTAAKLSEEIEAALVQQFALDSTVIKTLVISDKYLQEVIQSAPKGFGTQPEKYHSDVAFLIGVSSGEAIQQVEVNPAVDAAWQGRGVIYYRRLSAERTKSRLSKIAGKPVYKSMTIRTWNTVQKLYERTVGSSQVA